jgi:hypothetical protein
MHGLTALILLLGVAAADLIAQPVPSPLGVVRGVVRDTLGRQQPGVLLELAVDSATPGRARHRRLVAIDTADSEGRFEFSSVAPNRYLLLAQLPFAEVGVSTPVTSAGDTVSIDLKFREDYLFGEKAAYIRAQELAGLAEARARWSSARPARYRLTPTVECFCAGLPSTIRALEFVGDSVVATIDNRGRRRVLDDGDTWLQGLSVQALFAEAEGAIRSFERVVENVEYDPTYGFPTLIATDSVYPVSDVWRRFRITGFRPIR